MHWSTYSAMAFLLAVHGQPTGSPPKTILSADPQLNSLNPHMEQKFVQVEEIMPVEKLNPSYYPARRAAAVAQHHLNTNHGSPFKHFMLDQVKNATLEEVAEKGMKYHVEFSVNEVVTNRSVGLCSADVLFPPAGEQNAPQVQCSCQDLLKVNTTTEEEALYQQLKAAQSPVSGRDIPDSFGNIAPEMKPFWVLGGVASSFVMLRESNESTLYNIAQVASVEQLETQDNKMRFEYHVLLHELVSQEIIHWKLLVSWCPTEGVKVLETELVPKCHHCATTPENATVGHLNTN